MSKSAQEVIAAECEAIKELLIKKNQEYGNSALRPMRIFSRAKPDEQINVRIDDKLSRIANINPLQIKEDTVADLIGYLILKRVLETLNAEDEHRDME